MASLTLMLHPTLPFRKDGTKSVVLRVTHQRKRHYINMEITCPPISWDDAKGQLKRSYNPKNYKDLNHTMDLLLSKAEKILFDMESAGNPFNIEVFREELLNKKERLTVSEFFDKKVEELVKLGRIGNSIAYKQAQSAINRFLEDKSIYFHEADVQFLVRYESYLRQSGCANNTIDLYIRTFRSLYNIAIQQGAAKRELYPFYNNYTRSGYQIGKLKTATAKRAISMADLKKIQDYQPAELSHEQDAKLYFLFSYYAWGINFVDMAYLTWDKNIKGDFLEYTRAKTRHTKNFKIPIKPQLAAILAHFKSYSSGKYVFPIFNDYHNTPTRQKTRVQTALKKVNDSLDKMGIHLGISTPLTTYVARHTFASTLKSKEVPASVIKEMMGHANEQTTEIYRKAFGNDVLSVASEHLNIE
ncbi:MAG: site-specific integrase [Porphyromonadaceae bacterium]|nr:MAG: site-specific integrase [Porphyromonadaceae bacterium]